MEHFNFLGQKNIIFKHLKLGEEGINRVLDIRY